MPRPRRTAAVSTVGGNTTELESFEQNAESMEPLDNENTGEVVHEYTTECEPSMLAPRAPVHKTMIRNTDCEPSILASSVDQSMIRNPDCQPSIWASSVDK